MGQTQGIDRNARRKDLVGSFLPPIANFASSQAPEGGSNEGNDGGEEGRQGVFVGDDLSGGLRVVVSSVSDVMVNDVLCIRPPRRSTTLESLSHPCPSQPGAQAALE